MRTKKAVAVALAGVMFLWMSALQGAEQGSWEKIQNLLERAAKEQSPEARKAYEAYVGSLDAGELLAAAREGSVYLEKRSRPEDWNGAAASLLFVLKDYPQKADNLRDLEPILREIRAKDAPQLWRRCLVDAVTDTWSGTLSSGQRLQVVQCLTEVFGDHQDSLHVRSVMPVRLAQLVCAMWKASDKQRANEKLAQISEETVDILWGSFSHPKAPLALQLKIIAGLGICEECQLPGCAKVRPQVLDALQRYANYDESLWAPLASYALLDAKENVAQETVQKMLAEAKTQAARERLRWCLHRSKVGTTDAPAGRDAGPCGLPFDNVALSASPEKEEYQLGDQIRVAVTMQNVGTNDVQIALSSIAADYRLALFHSDGRPVARRDQQKQDEAPSRDGKQGVLQDQNKPVVLHSREAFWQTVALNDWMNIDHGGTYFLVVMRRIESWEKGFAVSNGVIFRVREDRGQP